MTDKKRTTVTTIETHEVWIVRRGMPELHDDSGTPMPETEPQPAIPTMAEDNNIPDKETEKTEKGKKMRNTFLKTIGGVALGGSLIATAMTFGISGNARAHAQPNICGTHTLRGSYVFSAHGWNIVGGVAVPKAIVEGIDFNGDGTLVSPFATTSINGTIIRSSGGLGTYTVEADCTGTLTFPGPGISFDIFVQPGDGKQVWMIQTGPTVPGPPVFEGTATKVSP